MADPRQQLGDYLTSMDQAGGGVYTPDFRNGFRHALEMFDAHGDKTVLCSQCGDQLSTMVKIGTDDGWCSACLDEATQPVSVVYELMLGSVSGLWWHTQGHFLTIEGAKAAAAEHMEPWHEYDDDDEVEPTNWDATWEMLQDTIGPASRPHPVGEPKPYLIFGTTNRSAFKIETREVT